MADNNTIEIIIKAVTENFEAVKAATDEIKGTLSEVAKQILNIPDLSDAIGKGIDKTKGVLDSVFSSVFNLKSALASTGVGIFLNDITKTYSTFDDVMRQAAAVSNATGQEFTQLAEAAKKMGADTAFSASQAAEALKALGQAGFSVKDQLSALPKVLQLASAGQLDLGRSAEIAANVLAVYKLKAEDLGKVNDILAKAANVSTASVNSLAEGFSYIGPVAAQLGIKLTELVSALGMLDQAGIKGSQGGTVLRGALSQLLKPTDENIKLLRDLGITVLDSSNKFVGFESLLKQLKTTGISTTQMIQLFGQEAGPGMLALLGMGSSALSDFNKELNNAGRFAESVMTKIEGGLGGALRNFESSIEAVKISLGEGFNAELVKTFNFLKSIIDDVVKNIEEFKASGQFDEWASIVGNSIRQIIGIFKNLSFSITETIVSFKPLILRFVELLPMLVELASYSKIFSLALGILGGTISLVAAAMTKYAFSSLAGAIMKTELFAGIVSSLSPKLLMLIQSAQVAGTAISLAGAAFAGWNIGKVLNEMDLFGLLPAKIGTIVELSMGEFDRFFTFLKIGYNEVVRDIKSVWGGNVESERAAIEEGKKHLAVITETQKTIADSATKYGKFSEFKREEKNKEIAKEEEYFDRIKTVSSNAMKLYEAEASTRKAVFERMLNEIDMLEAKGVKSKEAAASDKSKISESYYDKELSKAQDLYLKIAGDETKTAEERERTFLKVQEAQNKLENFRIQKVSEAKDAIINLANEEVNGRISEQERYEAELDNQRARGYISEESYNNKLLKSRIDNVEDLIKVKKDEINKLAEADVGGREAIENEIYNLETDRTRRETEFANYRNKLREEETAKAKEEAEKTANAQVSAADDTFKAWQNSFKGIKTTFQEKISVNIDTDPAKAALQSLVEEYGSKMATLQASLKKMQDSPGAMGFFSQKNIEELTVQYNEAKRYFDKYKNEYSKFKNSATESMDGAASATDKLKSKTYELLEEVKRLEYEGVISSAEAARRRTEIQTKYYEDAIKKETGHKDAKKQIEREYLDYKISLKEEEQTKDIETLNSSIEESKKANDKKIAEIKESEETAEISRRESYNKRVQIETEFYTKSIDNAKKTAEALKIEFGAESDAFKEANDKMATLETDFAEMRKNYAKELRQIAEDEQKAETEALQQEVERRKDIINGIKESQEIALLEIQKAEAAGTITASEAARQKDLIETEYLKSSLQKNIEVFDFIKSKYGEDTQEYKDALKAKLQAEIDYILKSKKLKEGDSGSGAVGTFDFFRSQDLKAQKEREERSKMAESVGIKTDEADKKVSDIDKKIAAFREKIKLPQQFTVDFKGTGSPTLPLSEKIDQMKQRLSSFLQESRSTITTKFQTDLKPGSNPAGITDLGKLQIEVGKNKGAVYGSTDTLKELAKALRREGLVGA